MPASAAKRNSEQQKKWKSIFSVLKSKNSAWLYLKYKIFYQELGLKLKHLTKIRTTLEIRRAKL